MIEYIKHTLSNGLRVLINRDQQSPLAAINLVYDVGSRDEDPTKTGLAHLFEHLMFSGTVNVPDIDEAIQIAGGDCNAFTNSDVTNFYSLLPTENMDLALWLEADRMRSLNLQQKNLDIQRKVVIEEFKETCLNVPYGMVWHHLANLAYKTHPYRWPTIGLKIDHIESFTLEDLNHFFYTYYRPDNAILSLSGDIDVDTALSKIENYFGDIKKGNRPARALPKESKQREFRSISVEDNMPAESIYLAFHMVNRTHPDYHGLDLITDILASGRSSVFYKRFIKEKHLCSTIDTYITGSNDEGLIIIEAKPMPGVPLQVVEDSIWKELEALKDNTLDHKEIEKYKNKIESSFLFSEMGIQSKASNLGYFELLGDADLVNNEIHHYTSLNQYDIQRLANEYLTRDNCSALFYRKVNTPKQS